jgi:catechol 2,3-dioxygenase-like lactoylglutathione lyase family enzyme
VDAAVEFYTKLLDFKTLMHPAPEFAILARENLRLLLSKPSERGGGGQGMPDGTVQTPGGWNRFEIEVDDLELIVQKLKDAGCKFRNEIVSGIGGSRYFFKIPPEILSNCFSILKAENENIDYSIWRVQCMRKMHILNMMTVDGFFEEPKWMSYQAGLK